jgi:O-antigen/teichoic acid export membrane protein
LKKLSKNILSIGISEGLSRLLGFFVTIFLARTLDVNGFGMINIGLTVFTYSVLFGSQWLNLYGTGKIAAGKDKDFMKSFFTLRIILSFAIVILVVFLSIFTIRDHKLAILISLFSISVIPNAINLDWYYQGKENLLPISFSRVLISLCYFVLLFIFFNYYSNYVIVAIAFFASNVIGIMFVWVHFLSKPVHVDLSLSIKGGYGILKRAFNLSIASMLTQVNINIPVIAIGLFLSPTDVGIFSAASKLVFFLLITDKLFYSIYFPVVTRIYTQSSDNFNAVISFVVRISLALILPVGVCCVFLANDIVKLVFGNSYSESAQVLKLLIWYFCVTILNSIVGYALVAIKKEEIFSKIVIYSTPIYLAAIFILTIYWGINGVAVAVVLYELVLLSLFKYNISKSVNLPLFNYILKVIPALAVLTGVLVVLHPVNILLSFIIGFMMYFLATYSLKVVTKSDLIYLKEKLLWN